MSYSAKYREPRRILLVHDEGMLKHEVLDVIIVAIMESSRRLKKEYEEFIQIMAKCDDFGWVEYKGMQKNYRSCGVLPC